MDLAQSVVEILLQKLANEASFLYGVRDQFELLVFEFERMVAFLEDADSMQEGNKRVKKWVQHVRDAAYDAEDVIDTFILKIATSKRRKFLGCIKRYACIPGELKALHDVGSEIQRINNKIHRISESRSTYGIADISRGAGKSSADPILEERRLTSPDFEEADFVGFQKDSEALVKKLTNESEQRRCVVSVVGMGGLGKTTLTKKVYNDPRVKAHFDSCAWISISQEYVVTDLLQKILNCYISEKELKKVKEMNDSKLSQLRDRISAELKKVKEMDVIQLRREISEHLKEKRYLMVLDDIWTKDAWNDLKDAFPKMNNGSRVVLTTRKKDVALYAQSELHEPKLLNEKESWELFLKKTFTDGSCPGDLEGVGKKIVEKCHGLPLAVVVIGGLLRTKTEKAAEWEKVHKSINWHFVKGEFNISGILSLSYKDLPYYLKPCFLYLGNFPEDYEFHAKKLIQMWAAEGFLEERGEETLEEVGEDYLMHLIQRSMVQVTERSSFRGIKKCRIHDLLRDLSISEAKEGMFLQVESGINANAPPTSRARRLAIHHNNSIKYITLEVPRNSLLVKLRRSEQFERQEWSPPPFSNLLKLSKLYLDGKLEKLPESAQFPVNLTKLTLEDSRLKQDPLPTLEKLEKLRILKLLIRSYEGKEMACSSQGFRQLESLHLLAVDELEEWRMEKGAMPSLLHLRIDWCDGLKKLPEGLQHVTTLKKLESWRMPSEFNKRLKEFEIRLKEDRGDGEGEGEDWHKIRHIPSIDIRDHFIDYGPIFAREAAAPAAEEEKKEEPAEESDDVAEPVFAGEAAAPAAACAAKEEKKEEPAEERDDVDAPVFAGEAGAPAAACAAEEEKKEEPAEESDDDEEL